MQNILDQTKGFCYDPDGLSGQLVGYWIASLRDWKVKRLAIINLPLWPDGGFPFITVEADLRDPAGREYNRKQIHLQLPVVNVVAVILDTDTGKEYAALVQQPRSAVGANILADPSGRIDDFDHPLTTTVLQELREEVGDLGWHSIVNLNGLWSEKSRPFQVSPGNTWEEVAYFVARTELTSAQLKQLDGSKRGVAHHGESITVHVVPVGDVLHELVTSPGPPDTKAFCAWTMYFRAQSEGML